VARGSVHQAPNGTWYIRYTAGIKSNGNRDQRRRGGYATREEADAALIAALHAVNTGTHIRRTRQTWGDYAMEWLLVHTGRAGTIDAHRTAIMALCPALGDIPLATFKAGPAKKAIALLGADYAPSTVRQYAATLRAVCRAAVKDQVLSARVLEDLPMPRGEPREHRVLEPAEVAAILAATADTPLGALWAVYARTGLRRGEGLGLCWGDLDLGRRRLVVRRQVTWVRGQGTSVGPVKGPRSARTIAIDSRLAAILTAHRQTQRHAYLAHGTGRPRLDLVFPLAPGVPINPPAISKAFARLAVRLDLAGTRLHDLRHARATHMLREGLNPRLVAEYLGHDVTMLLKVYGHILSGDQDAAVERLAALLDQEPGVLASNPAQ
jgi:integrase